MIIITMSIRSTLDLLNSQTVMCSTMRSQDLIESPEAARILGITVDQLRRRVKNGKVIPIIRKRNILLFSRKELSDSISEKNP